MKKAFTIAKYLGGGIKDIIWCLEVDQYVIEVLYLVIQRISAAEYVMNCLPNDRPTRDMLENYRGSHQPDEDLAFSELFPQLCMWIVDQEHKRKSESKQELSNPNDLSQYDYRL